MPQRRKRAIILASRNGLLPLPTPTHYNPQKAPTLFQAGLLPWETVTRATIDLPEPVGIELRVGEVPPPLDLHFGRTPTKQSLSRYRCVPEGGNRFDLQRKRPDLTPMCWVKKNQDGQTYLVVCGEIDRPSRYELNFLSQRRDGIFTRSNTGLLPTVKPLVCNLSLIASSSQERRSRLPSRSGMPFRPC